MSRDVRDQGKRILKHTRGMNEQGFDTGGLDAFKAVERRQTMIKHDAGVQNGNVAGQDDAEYLEDPAIHRKKVLMGTHEAADAEITIEGQMLHFVKTQLVRQESVTGIHAEFVAAIDQRRIKTDPFVDQAS